MAVPLFVIATSQISGLPEILATAYHPGMCLLTLPSMQIGRTILMGWQTGICYNKDIKSKLRILRILRGEGGRIMDMIDSKIIQMKCTNVKKGMEELALELKNRIDGELIYETVKKGGAMTVMLLSFEKWIFRSSTAAVLTLLLVEREGKQTADVIGAGGGCGWLNFSLGSNRAYAEDVCEILQEYGFEEDWI